MTGFARAEGGHGDLAWVWEVRSVNAKGLDLRFRPPSGFEALDPLVRARVNKRFKRGSLSVNLSTRRETGGGAYRINEDFLAQVVDRLEKAGLVSRQLDPSDRRRVLIQLTAQGIDVAQRGDEAYRVSRERILARMKHSEIAQVDQEVTMLLSALERDQNERRM